MLGAGNPTFPHLHIEEAIMIENEYMARRILEELVVYELYMARQAGWLISLAVKIRSKSMLSVLLELVGHSLTQTSVLNALQLAKRRGYTDIVQVLEQVR
ncbi:Hypothetical protein POVR2_LOCUS299 [uncultured virus]|nr:Hypothetical protein POVR2_LOCUS299 [uncultured virus]